MPSVHTLPSAPVGAFERDTFNLTSKVNNDGAIDGNSKTISSGSMKDGAQSNEDQPGLLASDAERDSTAISTGDSGKAHTPESRKDSDGLAASPETHLKDKTGTINIQDTHSKTASSGPSGAINGKSNG